MGDVAVRVQALSKQYRIGARRNRYDTIREHIGDGIRSMLTRGWRSHTTDSSIWALSDVGFEVERGEVVGIIGGNGAGKSTLLKILTRITEPTSGRAEIYGRVGSLLEVGTGFQGELTGRENIYLNGAILGMTKKEIDRRFDEIVAFSGVAQFLDTPVKRYSSGMSVRLAFAVAAHLEPEIMLVDEVLAVGDAEFQRKCVGKIDDVAKGGRTVLFVSHDMAAIERLCRRSLLLHHGHLVAEGPTVEVIGRYLESMGQLTDSRTLADRTDRTGNGRVRFTGFHMEDASGRRLAALRSGLDVVLAFDFESRAGDDIGSVDIGLSIHLPNRPPLLMIYQSYLGPLFPTVPRHGTFRCHIPRLPLAPGRYGIGARVTIRGDDADWLWNPLAYVEVETGDFYGNGNQGLRPRTPFLVAASWDLVEATGERG